MGKTTLLECLAHLKPVSNDDPEEGAGYFEPRLTQEENAVTEALGRVAERECRASATFAMDTILDRKGSDNVVEMSVSFTLKADGKAETIEFSRWPPEKKEALHDRPTQRQPESVWRSILGSSPR